MIFYHTFPTVSPHSLLFSLTSGFSHNEKLGYLLQTHSASCFCAIACVVPSAWGTLIGLMCLNSSFCILKSHPAPLPHPYYSVRIPIVISYHFVQTLTMAVSMLYGDSVHVGLPNMSS